MPFGNPEREKSFRCRSTHFFAKVSIFSFCVGVFNKNANTKVARKQESKSCCHLRRTPVQLTFYKNDFAPFACRAWWMCGGRCIGSKMSFSSVCYVARQSQGGPGGNGRAPFLATSWGAPRSGIKKDGTDQRALKARSMIVRRNGRSKFSPNNPNFSRCLR